MAFKSILGAICACLAVVSYSANASVINTLNGVNYEWLEVTETQGMSRNQVEAAITSATLGDTLYGYQYASRSLVEDLFLSYTSYDGLDGYHGKPTAVIGMSAFLDDFGATIISIGNGVSSLYSTIDGYVISYEQNNYRFLDAIYGGSDECNYGTSYIYSCALTTDVYYDTLGTPSMAWIEGDSGFDATSIPYVEYIDRSDPNHGSLLVRISAVPIPATVWLFGSGLIGLIGLARRKKV